MILALLAPCIFGLSEGILVCMPLSLGFCSNLHHLCCIYSISPSLASLSASLRTSDIDSHFVTTSWIRSSAQQPLLPLHARTRKRTAKKRFPNCTSKKWLENCEAQHNTGQKLKPGPCPRPLLCSVELHHPLTFPFATQPSSTPAPDRTLNTLPATPECT